MVSLPHWTPRQEDNQESHHIHVQVPSHDIIEMEKHFLIACATKECQGSACPYSKRVYIGQWRNSSFPRGVQHGVSDLSYVSHAQQATLQLQFTQ